MGSDSKNGVRHQRALSPRLSMMMMSDTKVELFSLNYKHYVRIRGSVIITVRERKFQGTKVPENESFTYGTFVLGNESSRVRKLGRCTLWNVES